VHVRLTVPLILGGANDPRGKPWASDGHERDAHGKLRRQRVQAE
jgi:hypothetical protein